MVRELPPSQHIRSAKRMRIHLQPEQKENSKGEPPPNSEDTQKAIQRLAKLSRLDYDRERMDEAKRLGVRVQTLDAEVEKAKGIDRGKSSDGLFLANPDPWPEPVQGATLLDRLTDTASAHLVLPSGAAKTIALWVVFAHAHDCFNISPVLAVTSPTPECGKTTLLTFLGGTVPRPLPSSNVTASTVFRAVEKWKPTLLIDEADTFLRDKDELRGVLNSGHNRGSAYVLRPVGEDFEPKQFCTWSPKAVALVGKLPPTLSSRSIHIRLRRKRASERVEILRQDRLGHLTPLLQQAARFAADNTVTLHSADPNMPEAIHGRAADNWRPLLAIADAAGGRWPDLARDIAVEFSGRGDEEVAGIMLLEDVQRIWATRHADRLHSEDMVADLVAMEDRPWPEWKADRPMTPRQLAKLLEPFEIRPKQLWIGGKNRQGYELEWFRNAFNFYLEGISNPRPLDSLETADFRENHPLGSETLLGEKRVKKPSNSAGSRDLADKNPFEASFSDGDPFKSLKDDSLKLKLTPTADDYPDLPACLDRRLSSRTNPH
jgi:putative DNA primase/helicase